MTISTPNPFAQGVFDVDAAIACELKPLPMAPERSAHLKRSLLDRVRLSAVAQRVLNTVSREDGSWAMTSPGVLERPLSAVGGLDIVLLNVEPGVALPWPSAAQAQEFLVLDGTLSVQGPSGSPVLLGRLNHLVVNPGAAASLTAGSSGVRLYVRRRQFDLDRLPALEAAWWVTAENTPLASAASACTWTGLLPGAETALLQAQGDVVSMLIRLSASTALPDHGHSIHEDCFMLDGEMYLGDILMREGDYQMAYTGGQHVGISSDAGGMFYFHGALPPTASELA